MRYRKVENLLRFRNPRRQDSKLFYRVAVLLLILLLLISPLSGMLVNADEAESESETSATENETETTPETELRVRPKLKLSQLVQLQKGI